MKFTRLQKLIEQNKFITISRLDGQPCSESDVLTSNTTFGLAFIFGMVILVVLVYKVIMSATIKDARKWKRCR